MKKTTIFSRFFRETRFTWVMSCIVIAIASIQSLSAQTIDYTATANNGEISTLATWNPTASSPSAGNLNVWSTGIFILRASSNSTFNGGTLNIATSGTLTSNAANITLTLNNIALNGGKIQCANNSGFTLSLQNKTLTLNSGYFQTNAGLNSGANLNITNCSLAGSGNIAVVQTLASTSINNENIVELKNTVTSTNFTGMFTVAPGYVYTSGSSYNSKGGTLKISFATANGTFGIAVPAADATNGVTLNGVNYKSTYNGKLFYNPGAGNTLKVTTLNLGGTDMPIGTYSLDGASGSTIFTAPQQVYINSGSTGLIQVVGPPAPTSVVATNINGVASVAFSGSGTTFSVKAYDVNNSGALAATITGGTSSPILVPGLTSGHNYNFTVNAIAAGVTSLPSTASADVAISAPGTVTAISGANTPVTNIYDASAWPNPVPVLGDANIWSTGAYKLYVSTTPYTFNGSTLNIASAGTLALFTGTSILYLNNVMLNGSTGLIQNQAGINSTLDLQGKTFTLNSGSLKTLGTADPSVTPKDLLIRNCSLAGSGTISIAQIQGGVYNCNVELLPSVNTTGFTGIFEVTPGLVVSSVNGAGGTLKLNAITSGTFGVKVWAADAINGVTSNSLTGAYKSTLNGKLYFTAGASTVTLTSLILGTTNIGVGTYTLAQLNDYAGTGSLTAYLNQSSTGTVTVTGAVNAPTGVVATSGNASATVAFAAPVNTAGYAITAYTVSSYDVTNSASGPTATGATSPITVTGLTNNHNYTFTVTATNAVAVTSAASSPSTAVTPRAIPNPPTNVVATAGDTQVSVAFTASVANGSTIDHYSVTPYVGASAGTPVTGIGSPIVLTGLTNGTAYTFHVTAVDLIAGASTAAISSAVTPAGVPDAPIIGTATNSARATASISFTAPVNTGGAPITQYIVIPRDVVADTICSPITVVGTSNPIVIANAFVPGVTYSFTVKASNGVFSSVASSASNSMLLLTNPLRPLNIVLTPGNAQVSVAFDLNISTPAISRNDGGSPITAYVITPYIGAVAGTPFSGTTSPIVVTGLTNGTAYTFKATCTNGTWISNVSTTTAVTPDATAYIIPVNTNTNTSALTLTPVSDISIASGYTLTVDGTGTLNVNTITVAPNAKLTLASGKSLTVSGGLTLQSSDTGSATVVDQNTGNGLIAGSINVQQYLTSGRNWYISSPISAATSTVFSATSSNPVFYYDETIALNESSNAWGQIQNTSTALTPTVGYIANMDATVLSNQSNVVTFTGGSLNSGAITTGQNSVPALTYTDNNYKKGFNLVGNPYASYLDWDNVSKTNVMSSIWLRTKVNSTYVFDTYNALGQLGTSNSGISVNNHIPPMQAFWVRATAAGASISFDNSMRTHKGSQIIGEVTVNDRIFKSVATKEQVQSVLRLQISNGSLSDETILYSNPNALNSFDDYDTPKMFSNNSSVAEIYTMSGIEQLAINGLNTITYDTEMPLGFNTLTSGNFSIKASQIANFQSGTQVMLKDYADQNNPVITDLTDGSSYSFSSVATSNNTSRFALLFHAPSIATGINPESIDKLWISSRNGQLVLNGNASSSATLEVFNAVGQKVISINLTETNAQLNNNLAAGAYLVKITNQGKSITKKIIID